MLSLQRYTTVTLIAATKFKGVQQTVLNATSVVRRYRLRNGWSVPECATAAKLSIPSIRRAEEVGRLPSDRTIARLAIAFRVPYEQLAEELANESSSTAA